MEDKSLVLFASVAALIPLIAVAMALGKLFSAYLEAVGRNPGAKKELLQAGMLGAALTEAVGLLAWLISLFIFLKY